MEAADAVTYELFDLGLKLPAFDELVSSHPVPLLVGLRAHAAGALPTLVMLVGGDIWLIHAAGAFTLIGHANVLLRSRRT